jgi:hypothetical protein
MTFSNEKVGGRWRAAPTSISTAAGTKKLPFDRRKIKAFRYDREAERLSLLRLHAGIRYNDLGRLIYYRRRHSLSIGPEHGWAAVLANVVECLGQTVDVHAINEFGRRLGLPQIDADIAASACRSAGGILMSAVVAGEFLEVTSCERTDAKIRGLEAVDESAHERKRRISRERQRRRRAVTRPYKNRERDTARKSGAGLRRFASRLAKGRSSTALPSRQEPRPFPVFPGKGKSQAGTTVETTGVADAHQATGLALTENNGGKSSTVADLTLSALASPTPAGAPKFGETAPTSTVPQPAASPPGEGSQKRELPWTIQPQKPGEAA